MVLRAGQVVLLCISFFLFSCGSSTQASKSIGLRNGALNDCPSSPNCVSTAAANSKHGAIVWAYKGTHQESMLRVRKTCESYGGATLEKSESNYLYYTFKTKRGGFTDDVEFYFDEKKEVVEFRSASRLGYSDLGSNRRRMKNLFLLYQ